MCAHACNSLPSTLGDGDIAALQPEEAACGPFFYPAMVGTPAGRAQRSQDRSSPASPAAVRGTKPSLLPGTCSAPGGRPCLESFRVPGPSLQDVLLQGCSWGLLASPPAGLTLVPLGQPGSLLGLNPRATGCSPALLPASRPSAGDCLTLASLSVSEEHGGFLGPAGERCKV